MIQSVVQFDALSVWCTVCHRGGPSCLRWWQTEPSGGPPCLLGVTQRGGGESCKVNHFLHAHCFYHLNGFNPSVHFLSALILVMGGWSLSRAGILPAQLTQTAPVQHSYFTAMDILKPPIHLSYMSQEEPPQTPGENSPRTQRQHSGLIRAWHRGRELLSYKG